jgi:hypothetical protein
VAVPFPTAVTVNVALPASALSGCTACGMRAFAELCTEAGATVATVVSEDEAV